MARTQSKPQPSLFPALDGSKPVGVFYFPEDSGNQAERISAIETTFNRLEILADLVGDTKTQVKTSVKYLDILNWIIRFQSDLETEKQKLLELNGLADQSMRNSMSVPAASHAG